MDFLLVFIDRRGAHTCTPEGRAALSDYARQLEREGRLQRAALLADDATGARVVVRDGRTLVTDGPFAESHEVMGGFWLVDAASREEAIGIARRAFELGEPRPEARQGAVDVHVVAARYSVTADPGQGVPFLLGFHNDPHLDDCDESKLREMIEYGAALERDGKLFETSPLERSGPPARIEARGGKTLVTEGPFAEAKEVIGGYSLLRAASREEAIEIATRYPAARWGTVEMREIVEPR
jgi:hypothetical protein